MERVPFARLRPEPPHRAWRLAPRIPRASDHRLARLPRDKTAGSIGFGFWPACQAARRRLTRHCSTPTPSPGSFSTHS